jgi:hypothetical protein
MANRIRRLDEKVKSVSKAGERSGSKVSVSLPEVLCRVEHNHQPCDFAVRSIRKPLEPFYAISPFLSLRSPFLFSLFSYSVIPLHFFTLILYLDNTV